jgi:hypothetical protein
VNTRDLNAIVLRRGDHKGNSRGTNYESAASHNVIFPSPSPHTVTGAAAAMAFVVPCAAGAFAARPPLACGTAVARPAAAPRARAALRAQAGGEKEAAVEAAAAVGTRPEIVLDENIGGFCSINPRTGKRVEATLKEKEVLFMDAMQAYFRGESTLSNDEFDALKEELTWQGSSVATLTRDEFKFLDAARAYEQGGKAVLSDEEFDALKRKLQEQGSIVAIQRGPRCSIRRQITFSDTVKDTRRILALYLPAAAVLSLVWLSSTFEFTPLRNVDPVISLLLGTPFVYLGARLMTQLVVPDPLILVGDCPSCGRRIHVFFGKVLNLEGYDDVADVKCEKCKAALSVEKDTNRMILVKEG